MKVNNMRATSRTSLEVILGVADEVIASISKDNIVAARAVGHELFAGANLLKQDIRLKRFLTEQHADKQRIITELINEVFQSYSAEAKRILIIAGSLPWSRSADLIKGITNSAQYLFIRVSANKDELRENVFRVNNFIANTADVNLLLRDSTISDSYKRNLLLELLSKQVTSSDLELIIATLLLQLATPTVSLRELVEWIARIQNKTLIVVTSSVELTAVQRNRLVELFSPKYGSIALEVIIDKGLIGGLSCQIGSEVIDATVMGQLNKWKREFQIQ